MGVWNYLFLLVVRGAFFYDASPEILFDKFSIFRGRFCSRNLGDSFHNHLIAWNGN